jgi:hypothetical protein
MEQVDVSLADIARIAGVRPSAVSNWRRRHDDFPKPVGGTDKNPRFGMTEVEEWLRREGKAADISANERLWQAFDSVRGVLPATDALVMAGMLLYYLHRNPGTPMPRDARTLHQMLVSAEDALVFDGNRVVAGLIDLLTPFDIGARETTMLHAVAEAASIGSPARTFDYLCTRLVDTGTRTGFTATPPELAELMLDLAGPGRTRLLDPACGSGTILLAAAKRGYSRVEGQELDNSLARITALRLAFLTHGPAFDIHPGDSLREDAYPRGIADAVVCNPPFADRNWGQEELASDLRWEFGVPSRLESELAWVQHALAHAAPGGLVVMLMPPAAAARLSGRRVRAELLRRGALRAVISLPPKLAAHYAIALQLWVLKRPDQERTPSHVLLVDASGLAVPGQPRTAVHGTEAVHVWDEVRSLVTSTWKAFNEDPGSVTATSELALAVPVITLLDDDVDLTPGRHVLPAQLAPVSRDDLASRRGQLADILGQLAALLPAPPFPESAGGDAIGEMTLDELAQTGALFIRRTSGRAADDKAEQSFPRVEGRILTGRDLARAVAPSEAGEVAVDEVRNPAIREGDVLVPLVARRLTARVAAGRDVGAFLSTSVFLIRTDPTTIDPWFLAGFLSSSGGGHQAARMTSTLGEHIRFDPRRVRIPLPPIGTQRVYGETFRMLWEFARTLRAAHDLGIDFVRDMIDVTVGTLGETVDREEEARSVQTK